jgi:hypothetical protein
MSTLLMVHCPSGTCLSRSQPLAYRKLFGASCSAFDIFPESIFTGNKLGERKTGALIGGGDEGQVRCMLLPSCKLSC